MANPGPASQGLPTYVNVPQNEYRLLGVAKAVNLAAAGDTPFPAISCSGLMCPATVVTANSSGTTANIATATVGIYTAPAQGGTVVLTTAALTGQTTQPFTYIRAATNPSTAIAGVTTLYVNVGTTVAGGVVDVYLYGYELN